MKRGSITSKLLDRYIGIPALVLLRLFKRKKTLPDEIIKVGILTVPAIGDVLLLKGLLDDLLNFNNQLRLVLFAGKEIIPILELMGNSFEIVEIDNFKFFQTINNIRAKSLDVFVDSSQWSHFNALLAGFSDAKFTIGFKTKNQFKHILFDRAVTHSSQTHELFNLKNLAYHPSIITHDIPSINLISSPEKKENYAVIHLMAGGYLSYLREWPEQNWIKVINFLYENNFKIYFTGSAEDAPVIQKLIDGNRYKNQLENTSGKLSFNEIAQLLKNSELVISINTGIMHLASMLNCSLIALHGPTDPNRWGPLNENAIIIKSDYHEAPCLNLGFEYNCSDRTGECMKTINPDTVINAINKILNNSKQNSG